MSFCRNCGTDVGENKFCANCGTAVADTAPNAAPTTTTTTSEFSTHYPQICEYERRANNILLFGVLSLIFCMGIGLIFEIINIVNSSKMSTFQPLMANDFTLANPLEMEKLQNARRKHKLGATLTSIALIVTGVLLFILILGGAILAQIG